MCFLFSLSYQANGKYLRSKPINVKMPAIVLLNPENAGSLIKKPKTEKEILDAEYWKERAFIYRMGKKEKY